MQFQNSLYDHHSSLIIDLVAPPDELLPAERVGPKYLNIGGRWQRFEELNEPVHDSLDNTKVDNLKKHTNINSNFDKGNDLKKGQPVKIETRDVEKPKQTQKKEKKSKKQKNKVVNAPATKKYQGWGFGKVKEFTLPEDNEETNKAAVQIQRIARGGWQRLKYKIALLQYKIDTTDERIEADKEAIREYVEESKKFIRQKAFQQEAKEMKKVMQASETATEGQKVIAFLRDENRKLREKNAEIFTAIQDLKVQNTRLEEANEKTADTFSKLDQHAKGLLQTNQQLQAVVPKYKERYTEMKDEAELRRQYCLFEHQLKVNYVKAIGTIVEAIEKQCKDEKLVEQCVNLCLEMTNENDEDAVEFLDQENSNEAEGSASLKE
jgi:urease gamma subunit